MKKILYIIFTLLIICSFSSCIFNTDKALTVERIEYIDETQFELYCTGYGEYGGLPHKEYIIISDRYEPNAVPTHKVVKTTPILLLFFIQAGAAGICEVDPPLESGEKIYVWFDTPLEPTYGVAEFIVP